MGKLMRMVVPLPTADWTSMRPPAAVTMLRETERPGPLPTPIAFVVKNGVNTRARTSGVSLDLQYRRDRLAEGTELDEGILQLGASYAPTDWLTLSMIAPVVLRDVTSADLTHVSTVGLGQLDVRGRFVLFRDRSFAPEHVLGLVVGLGLPTVVDQMAPNGQLLSIEAQSGSATVDPIAGAFYTWLAYPLSLFASASLRVPLAGRYTEAPGVSGSATLALQYRAGGWPTFRIALDGRLEAPSTEAGRCMGGSTASSGLPAIFGATVHTGRIDMDSASQSGRCASPTTAAPGTSSVRAMLSPRWADRRDPSPDQSPSR